MYKLILFIVVVLSFNTQSYAARQIYGNWSHSISRDPMTDKVSCTVQIEGADLPYPWFFFHKDGPVIGIVGDTFPGKNVVVRIDKNKAISERGAIGNTASVQILLAQIRGGGKTMLTEIIQWPSGAPEYLSVNLTGITKHIDACLLAVKKQ